MMATYGVHENGLCMWHNVGKKLCGKGSNGSNCCNFKESSKYFVWYFEEIQENSLTLNYESYHLYALNTTT